MIRVDIFRKKEDVDVFLVVPEGLVVPSVAARFSWKLKARAQQLPMDTESLDELSVVQPIKQIQLKGYALSETASPIDFEKLCSV